MFEVITQLQFVHRPPSKVTLNKTSETISINCSATAAPGLSIHTHWSINRNNKKESGCDKSIYVFSNGTLLIPDADECGIGVISRSQPLLFSIFGRRGESGAVALMSSCCRLYDKRSTKDRICLALSGYLSLMQTGWNFLLFVFLRIVLSCERRSHVSANV